MAPCTSETIDNGINRGKSRVIYISRHGESMNNLYGKIGGNASLSPRGEQYAKSIGLYFDPEHVFCKEVWTSSLERTKQTAAYIKAPKIVRKELDEINSGLHDSLTYEEIATTYPVEFAMRDNDKLNYRYPEGESYVDVLSRLTRLMPDIDRADEVLIISHQATIRCLMTLLLSTPLSDLPYQKIPLHTIMKATIDDTGVTVEYHRMPIDCVDTYRAKPENCSLSRNIDDAIMTVPMHL